MRISVFAIPALMLILWLEGGIPFAIMFFSALLHEAGHLLMMRLCGHRARRLDVLPMGALIVCPEGISFRHEVLIALAGPLTSFALSLASVIWFLVSNSANALFAVLINCVFALFNLLPERKLDGGKALYCFLIDKKSSETAEKICSVASTASRVLFLSVAGFCAAATGINFGVLLLTAVLLAQFLSK